jgi:Fic family protein
MLTLARLHNSIESIPAYTGWLLSDLGEYKGMQELFTRQAPQKLKTLTEFAIVESTISSNRIEGVEIDQSRIQTVVFGKKKFQNRNEEEIHGYKQALNLIHNSGPDLQITEKLIKRLHAMCRGEIWDAGKYKEKDSDIIQTYPDGRSRLRFRTVTASKTPEMMEDLLQAWDAARTEPKIHPLILLILFNLDFLCIHPFRDGNGRVSRLLFLLQLYIFGYDVGKYISLERLIEENKERYYETLEESSQGWHEGKNDPWPYVNYMLFIAKSAYREFESRAGSIQPKRGEKSSRVKEAVDNFTGPFTVSQIKTKCPEVSVDLIRKVLKELKREGAISTTGKGRGAEWYKLGTND